MSAAAAAAAEAPAAPTDAGGSGSKRDTKYDRQLRLWGARGQKALMESHILLLNAGPTGTELLKNLVLPGVGRFTIVDEGVVTARDCSHNFFVTPDSIGQPRAQVAAALLQELNPDVRGDFKAVSPEAYLAAAGEGGAEAAAALRGVSLVVATQCTEAFLVKLGGACASAKVPLLVARSYGLIGYLRLQLVPEAVVVDAKVNEENKANYNLALASPDTLPEVQALADGLDLEAMDHHALSRVPFVLLLLKAKKLWLAREGEGSLPPATTAAKRAFADLVKGMAIDPTDDNFVEALRKPYLAYQRYPLPDHTQALLQDPRLLATENAGEEGEESDFWTVVRAIKGFLENEGQGKLPLSGAIPDMASSTENYTKLQAIYRAKAATDRAAVTQRVGDLLAGRGKARDAIPQEEIDFLVKNAYSLQVLRTRPLAEELTQGPNPEAVLEAMDDGDMLEAGADMNPILFYLGLRAVDRFHAQHGRYPGASAKADAASLAADEEALWAILQEVAKEATAGAGAGGPEDSMEQDNGDGDAAPPAHAAVSRKHAQEMTRYGAAELHTIASILGGIGAQEAVKVVTQQYVPLDHTFVYNGVASVGGTYRL